MANQVPTRSATLGAGATTWLGITTKPSSTQKTFVCFICVVKTVLILFWGGANLGYNDHLFHYGYYIYAAAIAIRPLSTSDGMGWDAAEAEMAAEWWQGSGPSNPHPNPDIVSQFF